MNFIERFISHTINAKITEENVDENAKKYCDQYLEEINSVLNSRSVNETLVVNNASLDTLTNNSEGLNNVTDDIQENINLSEVSKGNDLNVPNSTDFETTESQNKSYDADCFDNMIDFSQITLDGKTDFETTEVSKGNDFNVPNLTDFKTTEAQNNSFEEDCFDSIIDFSQMTSDGSLSNIILDNLSDSAEIEVNINESILECPENQINEEIPPEDNTNSNIILDDFEKLLDEEIEKRNIKDTIEKLVLLTEKDCDYSLNKQQNDETKEGDQDIIHVIEIEGNLSIDNIPNNRKVVDDIISISSEDVNLHSDLENISISSQEESTKNNFTDNVNTDTESNMKSKNCTEKKIDDTLQINDNNNNINDKTLTIDENSCSSYRSSDFEFITEEEAHKNCLINTDENETLIIIQINQDSGFIDSECSSQNSAGPSNQSDSRNREITDYRNAVARYEGCNFENFMQVVTDTSYTRNHIVPEGDGYLNLFQGTHTPTVPFMMENKSTRSSSMYVEYEGIGAVGRERNSDNELAEEAEESEKIILVMYPEENRGKRRRF